MDYANIISGSVAAVVLAAIIFTYKEFYKQPKLTYQILRPYVRGDEKTIPIIFRNEGHANATTVRITINCDGPIKEISNEAIPEKLEIEKSDLNTIVYKLDRMTNQIGITTYVTLLSSSDRPIRNVAMTSDQGSGQGYRILAPLSVSDRIALMLGGFMIGIFTALFILWIKLS